MSELKADKTFVFGEECEAYKKSEADKVIAELKDKCQMHDFFWEVCGFAKRGFKNSIAVSEAYDRLEEENKELKDQLHNISGLLKEIREWLVKKLLKEADDGND